MESRSESVSYNESYNEGGAALDLPRSAKNSETNAVEAVAGEGGGGGGGGNAKVGDDGTETKERVVEIWNFRHRRQMIATDPDGAGIFCIDRNKDNQGFFDGTFPNVTSKFVVEQTGKWVGTPYYSLRPQGSNRYLTVDMYGDEQRMELEAVLQERVPRILPELVPTLSSYLVHPDTKESHEGPGYLNLPIGAYPGPPNAQQMFRLCTETHWGEDIESGDVGLMPFWGSYLRCLPWSNFVSQSPVLEVDEQWALLDVEDEDEVED